jgi:hypothetical protein
VVELVSQPDGFCRSQGHLVLAALGLFLAWPLVAWRMNSGKDAPA